MSFGLGIFIGLFAQGLLTLFALAALDDRKEKLAIILGGFVVWIWFGIQHIYVLVIKTARNTRYKSLIICPDGKIRYVNINKVNDFLDKHKGYYFARFDKFAERENWKIGDWSIKYQYDDLANVRYAPKKVWRRYERLVDKNDEM